MKYFLYRLSKRSPKVRPGLMQTCWRATGPESAALSWPQAPADSEQGAGKGRAGRCGSTRAVELGSVVQRWAQGMLLLHLEAVVGPRRSQWYFKAAKAVRMPRSPSRDLRQAHQGSPSHCSHTTLLLAFKYEVFCGHTATTGSLTGVTCCQNTACGISGFDRKSGAWCLFLALEAPPTTLVLGLWHPAVSLKG